MELNKQDIEAFFDTTGALVAAAEKIDEELALRLGSRFNVFDTILPNENRISDILCDLLDPRGSHGQGDRFLRAFLRLCKVDDDGITDTSSTRVFREQRTVTGRRIDLIIKYGIDRAVAIENKPWAGEQDNQLADYGDWLWGRYQEQFHLVYLSGDGEAPKTLGLWERRLRELRRFQLVPYNGPVSGTGAIRTLRDWAEHCAHLAEADKMRWFLKDLATWIDRFPSKKEESGD